MMVDERKGGRYLKMEDEEEGKKKENTDRGKDELLKYDGKWTNIKEKKTTTMVDNRRIEGK